MYSSNFVSSIHFELFSKQYLKNFDQCGIDNAVNFAVWIVSHTIWSYSLYCHPGRNKFGRMTWLNGTKLVNDCCVKPITPFWINILCFPCIFLLTDLDSHSLFETVLARDPRPGVRSIDWSPAGLAQHGGFVHKTLFCFGTLLAIAWMNHFREEIKFVPGYYCDIHARWTSADAFQWQHWLLRFYHI
jgi:hypothetical protein